MWVGSSAWRNILESFGGRIFLLGPELSSETHPQKYQRSREDFQLAKAGFILSQIDSIHHQVLVVGGDFKRFHELMRQSWKSYVGLNYVNVNLINTLTLKSLSFISECTTNSLSPRTCKHYEDIENLIFGEGVGNSFIEFISPFLKNREFFGRKRPWVACEISCSAAEPHP